MATAMTVLSTTHDCSSAALRQSHASTNRGACVLCLLLSASALAADRGFTIVREATAGDTITTENTWVTLDWDTAIKDEGAGRPTLSGGNQILLDAGHHLVFYAVKGTQAGSTTRIGRFKFRQRAEDATPMRVSMATA